MRRIAAMLGAAAMVLLVSNTLLAQAKPDFSGKWTREAPAGGAAAGGGGGGGGRGGGGGGGGRGGGGGGGGFNCGMACTITVTGVNMKIDRAAPDGTAMPALNFKLDGTDSSNPGRAGQDGTPGPAVVSKAKWDGNKVVITTERTGQDGTKVTSTQTLAIDAGKLTVSTSSSAAPDAPAQVATYTKG